MTERDKLKAMSEVLKPCPFCGDRATLLSEYNFSKGRNYYFIACDGCGIETKRACRKPDYAIECWNRRAESEFTHKDKESEKK